MHTALIVDIEDYISEMFGGGGIKNEKGKGIYFFNLILQWLNYSLLHFIYSVLLNVYVS